MKALKPAAELRAVSGVGVGLIGPSDLSISLSVPGEFEHTRLAEAVCSLVKVGNRHGVAPGIQVRSATFAWA